MPLNYGNFGVTKKRNQQQLNPFSSQKTDSVTFKGNALYYKGIFAKDDLYKQLRKQMPAFTVPQNERIMDMFESLVAVMDKLTPIADKCPDGFSFIIGCGKLGFFEPIEVQIRAGFYKKFFNRQAAEDLLATIRRQKSRFETTERFEKAENELKYVLSPIRQEALSEGRTYLNDILEKDHDSKTIIAHFAPMNRYLPKKQWLDRLDTFFERDRMYANMYRNALEEHNFLPPIPQEPLYNRPADYFIGPY